MKKNINKSIAFVYSDKGEYLLYASIEKEAIARGYKIRYTDNSFDKEDIIFYCQHNCYPSHSSKLSVVMLHDLGQQHGLWPNIWIKERWNKFDIGLLPNKEWVNMWTRSSSCSFANPRIGCFEVGWPKADILRDEKYEIESSELAENIGLDRNLKTILYAPSWENDNKQLEFVESLEKEPVNMLIKQYPYQEDQFPVMFRNIKEMERLCKGRKNVYILDPKTNVFTALALSDILVSEESSTLLEAMLAGKIAVSVTDWLIPDVYPPRLPVVPFEFVIKTKKKRLGSTLLELLQDYDEIRKNALKYRDENFGSIGMTASKIMEIIDACVQNETVKLSTLGIKRSREKYTYSIKDRFIWFVRDYITFLVKKYSNPDSNKIMHNLYILYKKCQNKLKKI